MNFKILTNNFIRTLNFNYYNNQNQINNLYYYKLLEKLK